MMDKVMIATDGSPGAQGAVEHGLDLAEAFDAEVHLIYVVETEATYILTIGVSDKQMKEYRQYGEEVISDLVERAEERGLEGVGVVKTGKIAQNVVEYAETEDVDIVIVGERGHGTIKKYLGSTSEKIMRTCPKPVTVVRSPE